MNLIITSDNQTLSQKAFQFIKETITRKADAVFGLPTGDTPKKLYQMMIDDHQQQGTSYREARIINLDEYVGLATDHPQRYFHFMRSHLIDHLDIQLPNFHIPRSDCISLHQSCLLYEALLATHPRDIQLLGLGINGHIGFNEPGTPFTARTRVVTLTEDTRRANARFFSSIDEVPKRAITMGIENILEAKKIVIMASGKSKAQAVRNMLEGEITEACPGSALRMHRDLWVIIDTLASQKLSDSTRHQAMVWGVGGDGQ
ncbi:MAG: glucosamine-6-phosphate deaminase [Candidatus Izemoplasmatales bacterium]|nr:glucosamine-6-phosphate deaminase [Candidatus Izemoplasmatales bacterium]MDD5293189.1 glucosamine-6-phosphate deaminase [Candidatus Izemoplasmatales bacterium]